MVKRNRKRGKEEALLLSLGIRGRRHTNNKGTAMIKSGNVYKEVQRIREKLLGGLV